MRFESRTAAGKMLAAQLTEYRDKHTVVLALPRGGIPLGAEIARTLEAPLDIIAIRKLAHPMDPELAIGAIDEHGAMVLSSGVDMLAIDRTYLERETAAQQVEAARRARVYRKGERQLSLRNRTVILVDDGVATGLTMRLAIHVVAAQGASRIIVAVPIAPADAVAQHKRMGAEVVVLQPPEEFAGAVGAHYVDFEQLRDEEVLSMLRGR